MGSLICSKVETFAVISFEFRHTSDLHPRGSDTETRLRYSWLSCSFCCQVFPGLWFKSWHNWDLQSCREWGSWICMKPTFSSCNSLWMNHSSPGTPRERWICHRSTCIPACSVLNISVSFILIMFSLTLNQWMQCTQIVIYQNTSRLGAGGSSCSASATISIYAWLGYWRLLLKCLGLSAPCQLVRWRKVTLNNETINAHTWPISYPTSLNID